MTCAYTCALPACAHRFTATKPLGAQCQCPKCGHLYCTWDNFRAWFVAPGKSAAYRSVYGQDGTR